MRWIKYQIVQSAIGEETVLINKKVGYNDENLAIAEAEAYDGYEIIEDAESFDKEPLGISFGGTGATNAEQARKNIGAAKASHTHTKSQISDFPTSMPASDVHSWAKAVSKPTYTAKEVEAVSKTGDTMTGRLIMSNDKAWVPIRFERMINDVLNEFEISIDASKAYITRRVGGETINYVYLNNNSTTTGKPIAVISGGTGATDAATARANLGAAAVNHTHSAADISGGTITLANGGTGANSASGALKNISGVPGEPLRAKVTYSALGGLGVVDANCSTVELVTALPKWSEVAFVHNKDEVPCLTDAPENYGYVTISKGYNDNYINGWFHGVGGNVYVYKYHTTSAIANGWKQVYHAGNAVPVGAGGTGETSKAGVQRMVREGVYKGSSDDVLSLPIGIFTYAGSNVPNWPVKGWCNGTVEVIGSQSIGNLEADGYPNGMYFVRVYNSDGEVYVNYRAQNVWKGWKKITITNVT